MPSYLDNKQPECCSGCGACKEACPRKCISMQQCADGFLFPEVNEADCVHCGRCRAVCPYVHPVEKRRVLACFSGASGSDEARRGSSSGGIFCELARQVIAHHGIVAGARFDEHGKCVHSIARSMEELPPLMGSKYVQSECSGVFPEIAAALKNGTEVLFAGTPCQVAGLRNYLGTDDQRLYCIDLACHGVPSARDYEQCREYLEKKHGGKLVYLRFRDKTRSGWYHSLSYIIEKDGKREEHTVAPYRISYYHFFLRSINIRKSCYSCPYVGIQRIGDLTLADYWRAEGEYREREIGNGISAILCNTEKGRRLLTCCASSCMLREGELQTIIAGNQPFQAPPRASARREQILCSVLKDGYRDTATYIGRKAYCIAAVKAMVPEKVKRLIRRCIGAKGK
ncbi:MAG: Coenzyme F420 hydrogenase/dehydrogenase, beta subunit C-terminal domain [Aristaeellaceae bacterium]